MRIPAVDLALCNNCGGCISVAPDVFGFNDLDFLQVIELEVYPEKEVDEAIALCPEDAIYWEETP